MTDADFMRLAIQAAWQGLGERRDAIRRLYRAEGTGPLGLA